MDNVFHRRRSRWRSPVRLLLLILILACAAFAIIAWRSPIPARTADPRLSFDAALVQRGARLAAAGSCTSCHTPDKSAPFAGGMPLATPFGTVYSTNITPENQTGIGSWTEQAFTRAMREGVARDGHHLYPVFPYDHYTRLADEDIHALYAYLMTRDPVQRGAHANDLRFPMNFRPLVAGWKLLFLDRSPFQPEPKQTAEWNRGAYLVESLGHCSACHSPRNALGAEQKRQYLAGGEAEGWYVPALNRDSPSPTPWTVAQLEEYLRSGISADHAIAGGPMQGVVTNLAQADPADVRAIAVYIHSQMGQPPAERQAVARAGAALPTLPPAPAGDALLTSGAAVYASSCARCHDQGRAISSGGALKMPLAIAVYDPDPRSFLHIVRDGITPDDNEPGRWMPGFAGLLTDQQIIALAAYLRHSAARAPAWPNLEASLQKVKEP